MTLALSAALAALWLVLAFVFAGVGAFVVRPADGSEEPWAALHAWFWTGVATVTGTLLAWHLVLPVDGRALAGVGIAGSLGLLGHRALLLRAFTSPRLLPFALPIAGLAVWIGNHALNGPAYDDYAYEFQAVRWNHDFPIVPGLANLHGPLGFNQSHHLLAALISIGPLAGHVNHVLIGLFLTVVVCYTSGALIQLGLGATPTRSRLLRVLFIGPAVAPILFGTFGPMVSSLNADTILSASAIVLACTLAELSEQTPGTPAWHTRVAMLLLVAAFAAGTKPGATAFSLVLCAGLCAHLVALRRADRFRLAAPVVIAMAIGLAMTLLVPLRSVILSGDAAYPSSVAIAPVDWRVTPVQATADRRALWTSSSSFSAVLSERYSVVLPVVLGLIASSCAIAWPRSNRRTDVPQAAWVYAILGLACAAGAAVWWNEAAASRCAGAYFWIAGSCAIVWSSERAAHVDAWPRRWLVLLGLAIALLEPAGRAAGAIAHGRFADVVDMIWLMPGRRYLPEVPEFGVPRRTQSGLLVYEAFTIGYDSPLPNTPDFNPDLEQRRRGDLGSGFRVRAPANTAPAGNARD